MPSKSYRGQAPMQENRRDRGQAPMQENQRQFDAERSANERNIKRGDTRGVSGHRGQARATNRKQRSSGRRG